MQPVFLQVPIQLKLLPPAEGHISSQLTVAVAQRVKEKPVSHLDGLNVSTQMLADSSALATLLKTFVTHHPDAAGQVVHALLQVPQQQQVLDQTS